jgi:hypothetical protein
MAPKKKLVKGKKLGSAKAMRDAASGLATGKRM